MAEPTDIIDIMDLLSTCGLSFTPNAQKLERMTDAWVIAFRDIPSDILKQAAIDYMAIETDWPAPAKLRAYAEKVKSRNGQSVSGGQFKDVSSTRAPFKGVYRVTGYQIWEPTYRSEKPMPPAALIDESAVEPPPHPEFSSWAEAAAWQEQQREAMRVRA